MTIYTLITRCGKDETFVRNFATLEGAQKAMAFELDALCDTPIDTFNRYLFDNAAGVDEYTWSIYETEVE